MAGLRAKDMLMYAHTARFSCGYQGLCGFHPETLNPTQAHPVRAHAGATGDAPAAVAVGLAA